jgi:hypothetical protein
MLLKSFSCNVDWKYGWFDTLVNIARAIGRRQDDHTRETVLWKAIYAIVVALVVHPEIVFL